jgi:hypothetical protein
MRLRPSAIAIVSAFAAVSLIVVPAAAAQPRTPTTPTNVDISQRHTNESEEAIAVNPTNPQNIVEVSNVDFPAAGMLEGVSFDAGKTWTTKLIGDNDNLGDACCDPSLSFDHYGNLFLTYLFNVKDTVPVALSTDGGLSFNDREHPGHRLPKRQGLRRARPLPFRRPADDHVGRRRGLAGRQRRRADGCIRRARHRPRPGGRLLDDRGDPRDEQLHVRRRGDRSGREGDERLHADTDGLPNDDAQFWGAFSNDGRSFTPNVQISAGTSNSQDAHNGIDFGDYSGLAYFGGVAHPAWADNSNSTGNNPDGTLHQLDVYTASVAAR